MVSAKGPRAALDGVRKTRRNRKASPGAAKTSGGETLEEKEVEISGANDGRSMVFSEPSLVPPGTYDPVLRTETYSAVDYENVRYSVGDHVALFAGSDKEWVCVIERIYASPDDGKPYFKGRWYWSVADVEEHKNGRGEVCRPSKNAKHELIVSDNRDSNLVEVINRKCVILSWKNFRDLYKRDRGACDGIYFCDRMYYHKAFKFQEMTHVTFPGDPIPSHLRPSNRAAECDEMNEQKADDPVLRAFGDDNLESWEAHHEPPLGENSMAATSVSTFSAEHAPRGSAETQKPMKTTQYFLF